ncbi:membrane protein [Streptomyces camponoticapitis]|uniref:Membrane protein n=1 Tax=Streptomyces camponoticapitis TaxID=1616125 RepID=A0ABQ2E6K8_9ACTN|nr:hypothetical protein [Streptomyces camponoticapitis]GGJ96828.1 membrane protein [Streptomyces camponoticapitis]
MTSTERPQDSGGEREGARRGLRRSPLVIASVAAAVLLAGGGGAYYATTSSDGGGEDRSAARGGDPDRPPLALRGTVPGPGVAPGEHSPYGVEYRTTGELPEGPGSAAVHHSKGSVAAADVARLAKALGVAGVPKLSHSSWGVGTQREISDPLLSVDKRAPGDWSFGRFVRAPSGDNCLKGKECPSGGDAVGDNPVRPRSGTGPVSEEAAKKAAAPVLKALGLQDAALDASQLMGAVRVVNAAPVIGGLPTYGWSTAIQVGTDGQVVAGNGKLQPPEKGDEYPVVGAAEAVKLLNESGGAPGTGGIGGCASAVPHKDGREPATPCEPKGKGGKPAEPVRVLLEKPVFGLSAKELDGRPALVPSWWFEMAGTGGGPMSTVTRTAVLPEYLTHDFNGGASGDGTAPPAEEAPAEPPEDREPEEASPIEGYSAEGSTLSVRFVGGMCGKYTLRANETASTVEVDIVDTAPPGLMCIAVAKRFTEKVTLDRPLGDREVLNAITGDAVPLRK